MQRSIKSNLRRVNAKCCGPTLVAIATKFGLAAEIQFIVLMCQHVNTDSIEVKEGHHEMIHFGAPGKFIMDIEVTGSPNSFTVIAL